MEIKSFESPLLQQCWLPPKVIFGFVVYNITTIFNSFSAERIATESILYQLISIWLHYDSPNSILEPTTYETDSLSTRPSPPHRSSLALQRETQDTIQRLVTKNNSKSRKTLNVGAFRRGLYLYLKNFQHFRSYESSSFYKLIVSSKSRQDDSIINFFH